MAKNQELTEIVREIKYREEITQDVISQRLGVTDRYLSGVINGRYTFSDELRNKIYEVFSYIRPSEAYDMKNVQVSASKGRPYYNVDFIGGFDLVMNDQTILPEYNIDFQPYNKDGVFWCNISGHSMEPAIGHGDMIAMKEVLDWNSYITFGEIYAIVTRNDLRTVKIVRKGKDDGHFLLVPINTKDYDEQQIEKSQIVRVFSVLGCLKKM